MRSFTLLLLLTAGLSAAPRVITGTVHKGQNFKADVGSGLRFVLSAEDDGWLIRIVPIAPCADEADYGQPVNSPYHGYNDLMVDSSYGELPLDAVKRPPRRFVFVTKCDDYKTEYARLTTALGNGATQQESDEALAKLGTSPMGKGKFTILSYKVGAQIDWIRFKLEIDPKP